MTGLFRRTKNAELLIPKDVFFVTLLHLQIWRTQAALVVSNFLDEHFAKVQ